MTRPHSLTAAPTVIETRFPVSRLSKEGGKERGTKNEGRPDPTLTGLGKRRGRHER